jgi:hypothetical protein
MHVLPIAIFIVTVAVLGLFSLNGWADRSTASDAVDETIVTIGEFEKLSPRLSIKENDSYGSGRNDLAAIEGKLKRSKQKLYASKPQVRSAMQVIISLGVLVVALYIIVSSRFDAKDKHWAYGSAGTILGFWLKN